MPAVLENLIKLPLKKPSEEELAKILNYKRNYWQDKVVREARNTRFLILACGTRSGKSHFATLDPEWGVVSDLGAKNRYIWICAPTYSLTERIWNQVRGIAYQEPFKNLIKTFNNTKGFYNLTTLLGTTIEAKSTDDYEKLVGVGLDKVIIDEAGLVDEKAWKISLRTRLIDMGTEGRALIIGTPKSKSGWFYELYLKGQDPNEKDYKSFNFSTYDNKDSITGKLLLKSGLEELEKLKKDLDEVSYKREILGIFEEAGMQVFTDILKNIAGTEFRDFNPEHLYLIGVDLGRVRNRTVIFVVNQMTNRIDYCEHFSREDWKVVVQKIKAVCEKYDNPNGYFDATSTGGDIIAELLENEGVALEPFVFTDISKREAINKLAYFVNSGKLKYPQNETIKPLFDEMQNYGKFESEKSSRLLYKPISTRWGEDFITALSLALWELKDEPLKHKFDRPFTFPQQTY